MRVEIIVEVSSNHGGDVTLAKQFIWRFAEAGADWIKFQTTRVRHLRRDDPQYDWFRRAELSDDAHHALQTECERAGVRFLTTIYHADELPLVQALGLDTIKIGSGEAGEADFMRAVQAVVPRVIASDGLCPPAIPCERLKCVTRYPCPHGMVPEQFGRTYHGWSDHCRGLDSCEVAILRGARIIEKHVQLPHQARPPRPFEATAREIASLRAFADEQPTRFLGRWRAA